MNSRLALLGLLALCAAIVTRERAASAHPITVDGMASDWSTRGANGDNLGIVARDASQQGEYVWRDATGDARTDLATPETEADIVRVQLTGSPTGLGVLVQLAGGAAPLVQPAQIQIAVDTDRVAGSGETDFAGFADTQVADSARWERLIQTQLGGTAVRLWGPGFVPVVSTAMAARSGNVIELFVPWTALGLAGPPTTPLRLTVASFREDAVGDVVDIGGAAVPDAIDNVSDYGDPRATAFPNSFTEFTSDSRVDYNADVYFSTNGEVYAPLLVTRFVAAATNDTTNGGEWVALRNMTPASLSLAGFKVGDEETPDGAEGMYTFPAGATLAAGATYIVAQSGTNYSARYGRAPDAEFAAGSATVPDMAPFALWATGSWGLANAGDEILALDPSNAIVDVVTYGSGVYPGVVNFATAPTGQQVLTRLASLPDRDDNAMDFRNSGSACATDTDCGACSTCVLNACEARPLGTMCSDGNVCNGLELCDGTGVCAAGTNAAAGTSCADANLCNGAETCNGSGVCSAGTPLTCNDSNPCTTDSCVAATGCAFAPAAPGTSCSDGDMCNGAETCNDAGMCISGTPLTCTPTGQCTTAMCVTTMGCVAGNRPMGASCDDGDACTTGDACDGSGACAAGAPRVCNDSNACTTDSCVSATGCVFMPVGAGASCSDGDACNGAETCTAAGVCAPGTPLDCDDGNPCTADSCSAAGGCSHMVMAGLACSDGDACTTGDACNAAGACVPGAARSCDDGNPCTMDSCAAATGCANAPVAAGTSCADANHCNGDETCNATGACVAGTPVTCAPTTVPCRVNQCVPATGACMLANAVAGTLCDDGDLCNGLEVCDTSGACVMGVVPADAGAVCSDAGDAGEDGGDAVADAGSDSGADDAAVDVADATPADAGEDAVADGETDGAPSDAEGDGAVADASEDAVADGETDAGEDAATDGEVDASGDGAVADATPDAATDAAPDAAIDAAADAAADAPADAVLADARPDARPADGARDAAGEGGLSVTGGGACACRAAGAPANGREGRAALVVGLAVAALASARRRRRARRSTHN